MRLGVDFDNTIVCYDDLFHRVARERQLIPDSLPAGKSAVRDLLRRSGREDAWTEMQGCVYGSRMREAAPFPGVVEFFRACRGAGIPVCIISHKTRFPFRGEPHDLHAAALEWLDLYRFFDVDGIGLPRDQVFFESTKESKLERIAKTGCTHFVDDLPEFLAEPAFPARVLRVLFDPHNPDPSTSPFLRFRSWDELRELLIGEAGNTVELTRSRELAAPLVQASGVSRGFLLQPLGGGANNRVFRVRAEGVDQVLKVFYQHPDDPRDRFSAERAFYAHLWDRGVRQTPEPCGWDEVNRLGLISFLPGRKLRAEEITTATVGQALEFILAANQNRARVPPGSIPHAAEACFSVAEHLALVDQRVARLQQMLPETRLDAQAAGFARDQLVPAWEQTRAALRSAAHAQLDELLPTTGRCLSPSDFGFHNAIQGADGRMRFFDFEYAGWDDPAKLICDFFCQPQLPVPSAAWDAFVFPLDRAFASRPGSLVQRAQLLWPAYRVKWCCILLNDFLPRDRARRAFALGTDPTPERKGIQLQRAREWLHRTDQVPWAVGVPRPG